MAHVLQLMSSTDNTITFTSGNMYLKEYVPQVSMDGGDIRESAVIGFTGSLSTIRANIQAVNRLFDQARAYDHTQIRPQVFLEFDPDTSGTLYRSPVRNGWVKMTERVMGNQWGAANLELDVEWIRAGYWEGPLTQLPLSTSQGEYATTDVTIYNAYDSLNGNYTDIYSDVLGDLPAPAKIQIENSSSGSDEAKEFFIWINDGTYYSTFNPLLEAEDSTGATVTPSSSTDASGGDYATLAWTATTETLIATWDLDAANLSFAQGQRYAILARWFGAFPYTNAWIRFKLVTTNGNVVWTGNLSLISSTRELAMIDVLRLPHHVFGVTENVQALQLKMYGFRNQSGTHSISLDYIQFSPISRDGGWLRLLSVDKGIPYQDQMVYDGTEGEIYHRINSSGRFLTEFTEYGGPLLLSPNNDFRVYYNACNEAGAAKIDQTFLVKMWYRPRRHTV